MAETPTSTGQPITSAGPLRPTTPTDWEQLVTVDLKDTDIKNFIRLMAEWTKTNWIFDPSMAGRITMLGPQQMTLREAYHLLRAILEFRDQTVEEVGKVRRIVPRSEGKIRNTELRFGRYTAPDGYPLSDHKLYTQFIHLKYRSVNDMRSILVNFARDASSIIPYVPTNSLFITDDGTYIHRLMEVIRELDTPEPAKQVAMIRLKFALVKSIMTPLNEILKQTHSWSSGGAGPAGGYPVTPPAAVPVPAPGVPPSGQAPPAANPSVAGGPGLIADEADNMLYVIGLPEEIQAVRDAVSLLDKDPEHTPNIRLVTLRYTDPETVARLVSDVFKTDPGLANSSKAFTLIPDKRTGSLLLTTFSPMMLERLLDLIAKLDRPILTSGATIRVYKLEYAEAKKVAEVINGLGGSDEELGLSVAGGSASTGPAAVVNVRPGEPAYRPPMPGAPGAAPRKRATVIADEPTNSLVIVATREKFEQLVSVIKELDVVRPQVLVEVLIVSIDVDHARHLGLDFNGVSMSGHGKRPFAIGSTGQLTSLFSASGVRNGLNLGVLDSGPFDIGAAAQGNLTELSKIGLLINVLATDSRANILSAPKLLTGDNQEAKITVGSQVRIPQGSTLNAINTITNFTTEDLGVILELTPRITKNDFVALKIKTQIKNLIPGQVVAGIPVISNSDIETNITVENKATIVMGGLIQEDNRETVTKIPLLANIPVVGKLFRDTQREKIKSNLMVFMTPHIIRNSAAAAEETQRISPVLRHVVIKAAKRPHPESPGDLLQAMDEAR